jgi:hypothetical protein
MSETAGSETQSTAGRAKQQVQETTGEAAQQMKQKAGETAQQVRDKAQGMKDQASGRLREQVDTRSTEAGSQLQSTAQAARRTSEQLRGEGKETPAKVADAVADRAERLGGYLTSSDADRILRDVENTARRQPWLVAFGGAVLGFLAARFVKASSSRRFESGNGAAPGTWQASSPAVSAGGASAPELPAHTSARTPMELDEPVGGVGSPGTAAAPSRARRSPSTTAGSRRGGSGGNPER